MSDLSLTKTMLRNGIWEGIVTGADKSAGPPKISVRYLDQEVDGVALEDGPKDSQWTLRIPIPIHAVADGVHAFVIYDQSSDSKLADFTLIAGEALADDIRAETELLRAELDMLKRAFRRHCLETM